MSVVKMTGIVKRFGAVLANDHVDLELEAGEIHALLGENGAGKTTLMNVLSGLYAPDEGEITVNGQRCHIDSPRKALALGIGMVHQHFMLAAPLTVAENIVLGMKTSRSPLLGLADAEARIRQLSEKYHLQVDPKAYIWQLSAGERQRVEILKLLYREANILILDEPTAVLTPGEAGEMYLVVREMARQGHAVVLISHKLEEVTAWANRITVLRDGRVVDTVKGNVTTAGAGADDGGPRGAFPVRTRGADPRRGRLEPAARHGARGQGDARVARGVAGRAAGRDRGDRGGGGQRPERAGRRHRRAAARGKRPDHPRRPRHHQRHARQHHPPGARLRPGGPPGNGPAAGNEHL